MATVAANYIEDKALREKVKKGLLYVGLASIAMMFISLTSAYIVRVKVGDWTYFELPRQLYFSTTAIILSSITMIWAVKASWQNKFNHVLGGLALTLLLGLVFSYFQVKAWGNLVEQGVFLAGSKSNVAGGFLYILSGLHLLHLAAGIIALLVALFKAKNRKYTSENNLGLRLVAIYWHFLDILWVYLFVFLIYIH
ncbi:MAG: cytochrome oxidase subunit III [Bacteroidetes bacterium]|nr:MAG: cytochrome oxidase subunit III [Bacteroidota bacterium]